MSASRSKNFGSISEMKARCAPIESPTLPDLPIVSYNTIVVNMIPALVPLPGSPWTVLPPGMHAANLEDVAGAFATNAWPVVAGIGIGPQDAAELPEMLLWMVARPITGRVEQSCRWCRAAEGAIAADIDPGAAGVGLALRQDRHRGVVAMQTLRREHMVLDPRMQGAQRRCA